MQKFLKETTKIHVLLDEKFHLVKFLLSAVNVNDNLVALLLLQGLNLKDKAILADKAYSNAKIRDYLEKQGAVVCIPDKVNAKVKHEFDEELYKQRNIIKRFFQRIKNYRHVATRYYKPALCFENFVLLAACVIHF